MFKKQVRMKSQSQLKSSEKKKLASEIRSYFPALTEYDIACFTNSKENIVKMQLTSANDEYVDLFLLQGVPMFFEITDNRIRLPTVFMAWKFPNMVPTLTTNAFVIEKLKLGVDLFVPGVITAGLKFTESSIKVNDVVFINAMENKAPMCVGYSKVNKDDLLHGDESDFTKRSGTAVKVIHTIGDHLCKLVQAMPIPKWGPPEWVLAVKELNLSEEKTGTESAEKSPENIEDSDIQEEKNQETQNSEIKEGTEKVEELDPEVERNKMNELLEYCFLKGIKTAPKTTYPVLPATFYANYVLHALPKEQNLNIKKTTWKKFSTFLQEKGFNGVIQLQQLQKNEFKITGVNLSHASVREFVDPFSEPISVETKLGADGKPLVQQVFSVTAATLPFFSKQGFKKHDELTRSDVRTQLNEYIKREDLQTIREKVVLDPILSDVVRGEVLDRGDLLAGILDKMSVRHKIETNGAATVHKGKMPSIEFELATRSGNKKVTLISNLECFGVDIEVFCKELMQKAAASVSVTTVVPGKKGPQVQVQGNQILAALSMLKERKIQEKFMKGLDKAPKSKKKWR